MNEFPTEEEFPQESKPCERPLECSECRKQLAVRYTEIEHGQMHEIYMCNECPELQKKLKGSTLANHSPEEALKAGLTCGDCGTTMDAVRMGHSLGCSHCYEIFSDVIVHELLTMGKLPSKLNLDQKNAPLHTGRAPGESVEISSSMRLIALNDALRETLKREDYEQAAKLRDQINALTDNDDEKKSGGGNGKKRK